MLNIEMFLVNITHSGFFFENSNPIRNIKNNVMLNDLEGIRTQDNCRVAQFSASAQKIMTDIKILWLIN